VRATHTQAPAVLDAARVLLREKLDEALSDLRGEQKALVRLAAKLGA
jgi:hypothetical protein